MRKSDKKPAETQINGKKAGVSRFDRRLETRAACERPGRVIVDENTEYECIFKDLSWFGARLELHQDVSLPEKFKIAFSNEGVSFYRLKPRLCAGP